MLFSTASFLFSGSFKLSDSNEDYAIFMKKLSFENAKLKESLINTSNRFDTILSLSRDTNYRAIYTNYKFVQSLDSLKKRFDKIEAIIAQDPSKSLELTLIRKDLEHGDDKIKEELEHIKSDIDKTNTIIISSLLALVVGIFTQYVSNIGKNKSTKENVT